MPCDDDHQFQYPWLVKRHVREVHSGFGYKCPRPKCGRVLSRHMRHHPCEAQPRELFLYHRQTGARGEKNGENAEAVGGGGAIRNEEGTF